MQEVQQEKEENGTDASTPGASDFSDGKTCPYCSGATAFIESSIIYGTSYGMVYLCKPCSAYVGVHKGTDKALGRLGNEELREAKRKAHFYFDKMARTGLINQIWRVYIPKMTNRNKAYLWLSLQLNIPHEKCHTGMFDVDDCERVVALCIDYINRYAPPGT